MLDPSEMKVRESLKADSQLRAPEPLEEQQPPG